MTPQEQQLVNELFARLAQLEGAPRDPEAEHLIAEGLKKAPNAAYALVQTTLVQDEALKRASSRIQELQAQVGDAGQSQRQQSGFLDSMRNALFGTNEPHAPVSTVHPQAGQSGSAGTTGAEPKPGYSAPGTAAQPYTPAGPTYGSGGSFLGTAAAAAAGVIGGGLLRSMFGHRSGSAGSDRVASGDHSQDAALRESNLGDNDPARQRGIDDVDQNYIDENDTEDDGIFGDDDTYADDDTDDV
jgi:hypothetical protein